MRQIVCSTDVKKVKVQVTLLEYSSDVDVDDSMAMEGERGDFIRKKGRRMIRKRQSLLTRKNLSWCFALMKKYQQNAYQDRQEWSK